MTEQTKTKKSKKVVKPRFKIGSKVAERVSYAKYQDCQYDTGKVVEIITSDIGFKYKVELDNQLYKTMKSFKEDKLITYNAQGTYYMPLEEEFNKVKTEVETKMNAASDLLYEAVALAETQQTTVRVIAGYCELTGAISACGWTSSSMNC